MYSPPLPSANPVSEYNRMIGSIASFVLPSGFNPFLAGERLREIGERLHGIAAASSAADAQAAWDRFFCPRPESADWCDHQVNLIWQDQTHFVREATRAGIPWEKANATFDEVVKSAKEVSRMPAELVLWWTSNVREELIRDRRPREWKDQDIWQIAWERNHPVVERAVKLIFPAVNALDELGRHIWDFHRSPTTSPGTQTRLPDATPSAKLGEVSAFADLLESHHREIDNLLAQDRAGIAAAHAAGDPAEAVLVPSAALSRIEITMPLEADNAAQRAIDATEGEANKLRRTAVEDAHTFHRQYLRAALESAKGACDPIDLELWNEHPRKVRAIRNLLPEEMGGRKTEVGSIEKSEHSNWTHNRAPGTGGLFIPRPRVSEADVRQKVLNEVKVAIAAVHDSFIASDSEAAKPAPSPNVVATPAKTDDDTTKVAKSRKGRPIDELIDSVIAVIDAASLLSVVDEMLMGFGDHIALERIRVRAVIFAKIASLGLDQTLLPAIRGTMVVRLSGPNGGWKARQDCVESVREMLIGAQAILRVAIASRRTTPRQSPADDRDTSPQFDVEPSKATQLAMLTFEYAQTKKKCQLEDREAYDFLKEQGIQTDEGDCGELSDYSLPAFDTWTRYLREYRQAKGQQKYKRRGRAWKTRSIASIHELDMPADDSKPD